MAIEASAAQPAKQQSWRLFAVSLLFFLPLISGVANRLMEPSRWFRDYYAIACGAEKWLQGQPIYDREMSCAGLDAMPFVYHPWVAEAFSWPLAQLGQQNLTLAYATVYVVALLALLWLLVGRGADAPRSRRAWFAGFLTGSTVYWGNVAIVLHALIGLLAFYLRRRPSLLAIAIAVAAVVKPIFLTFAVIFLLAPWPAWRRIAYGFTAVALGAAPSVWFALTGGETATSWREPITFFVYIEEPADGYLGWFDMFGLSANAPAATIGYPAFAAAIALAGVIAAEGLSLSEEDRISLGFSIAILAIPRLMPHDLMLLGLGFAALLGAVSAASQAAGVWLGRALLGVCIVALVGNLADLADVTTRLCTLALSIVLVAAAGWVCVFRKFGLAALVRAVLRGSAAAP